MNKPISQLAALTGAINPNTLLVVSIGGANFKMTIAQLHAFFDTSTNPIVDVSQNSNILTFVFADETSKEITIASGGTTGLPSLRVPQQASVYLSGLSAAQSISDEHEIAVSTGANTLVRQTILNLKNHILTGIGGSGSGGAISIAKNSNITVVYSGSAPTIAKSPGVATITVPADTIIISMQAVVVQAQDQNGSNSGYNVDLIFPTGEIQTLPYNGTIDTCPHPETYIYTLTSVSAQKDYVDSSVTPLTSGLRVTFAETFPASGAKRSIGIRF